MENDGEDQRGPSLACTTCHDFNGAVNLSPPNFISGTGGDGAPWDLSETDVCDSCHSPGGIYDGVVSYGDSVGAKDNWATGVYDGNDLAAGKEKWCVGCHDDNPAVINGVNAPNVAGNFSGTAGYYNTGHGKHGNQQAILCSACHDTALAHVDGEPRTYSSTEENYQDGYRLKLVDGQEPMDIPRSWSMGAWQFRLCFSCHDSAPFLTYSNTDTNFRSDVDNSCAPLDPLIQSHNVNKHYYHLQTGYPYQRWDSDVNGLSDSVMSCPACHNVHGPELKDGLDITHAPAMIRTGELLGRASSLNLDYMTDPCSGRTHSTTNELAGSTGGEMKFYWGGPGTIEKNGVCSMCHNEREPYWRVAKVILDCGKCHTSGSHTAHSTAAYGPQVSCDACHDTDNFPLFSDGQDLANTTVCDNCHSTGGNLDGVNDATVGAKNNWTAGVYTGGVLTSGKEMWCASCHDADRASSNQDGTGDLAPDITRDNITYGYYVTGHGLASGNYTQMAFQEGVGNGNPAAVQECDDCHSLTTTHFNPAGKRLLSGYEIDQANSNCNQCHPPGIVATAPPDLYTNSVPI
jgi:hypothetical protein